jgi:hypothetical protein
MNAHMTTGRNDPCPCGSTKKYKHCCLAAASKPADSDFLWRKLRQVNAGLIERLLECAVETFGKEAIYEAWDAFTLWQDVPFDPLSPHAQVFWPWFYYDWRPDPEDTQIKAGAPLQLTVAAVYRQQARRLDPLQMRYLEANETAAFSFHDVVTCEPGKGFTLRDLFTGDQRWVIERMGSEHAAPGGILFAKVVVLDEFAEINGCTAVLFPPMEKAPILELRRKLNASGSIITSALLKDYDLEMFAIYHEVAERLLNPPPPILTNTDGDPFLLHKLVYDIDSPQLIFDTLKSLALDATGEELLAEAGFDAQGALHSVRFPWLKRGNKQHQHWDNTVIGHLHIEGHRLSVEVNSAQRAKKFAALAKKLLGKNARYRTTVTESPEAMLGHGAPAMSPAQRAKQETLDADPAVQAQLAHLMAQHYENWPSEKLPALGGKTPKQAVKTPDGREMVEALLEQLEQILHTQKVSGAESILRNLRQRLKLE